MLIKLRYYLNNILVKGYINYLFFLIRVSILFIPKKDRRLRFYIDYRGLNIVIVKNHQLLSIIIKILDRLYRSKVFLKLDLKNTYNRT